MKKKILIPLGFFFLIASMAACAPSRLDIDYGTSFKLQKYNQIADLDAGKNDEPVEGMDGKAAQATKEKYEKGFVTAAPAPVYTLRIGGVGTAGGGR